MQAQCPAADGQLSLLTPSGYQHSSCGYCKSKPRHTRAAIGAVTSSLQPSHYQSFVDRGWRRSGSYLYKPDCRHSCCPHYTIRLDASAYRSTKDQRKVINRWNKYVLGQDYIYKAARLCPWTREAKRRRRDHFDLSESVHASEYSNVKRPVDPRTSEPIEPAHKFEVILEPDNFTEEKYALYANYQRSTHGENRSEYPRHMFKRFLCSGMKQTVRQENGISQSLGSYHQCYRLDGRLVAFGVLDLLPSSVSSVYLVYHEDFVDWNFGKISALRELEMALQGGYQYYYMGFYIHSCIKMRYKGSFKPTYVLDPETYTWDVLDSEILQRMSVRKYVAMSRERLFNLPATSNVSISNQASIGELAQRFNLDLESSNSLSEYLKSPVQSSTTVEPEISFESVFEAGMPGVMTLDQVRQEVDLGQWKMKYGNIHCKLEDLVAWEEGEISDTSTIKGIVAELAASIGPDLVQQTMLEFQK